MGYREHCKRLVPFLGVFLLLGSQAQDEKRDFPAGWSAGLGRVREGQEEYAIFVDRRVKHGGKASCSIKSELPDPESAAVLIQSFKANDYRGKRLRMTAFVKTEGVKSKYPTDGGAGLWLCVNGAKKDNLAKDNMLTRRIRGTTEWKAYAVVVDVPEHATEIHFGMLLGGSGTVWVDDFMFEVVRKDVMTTGGEFRPSDRTPGARKDLPKKPKNLDFEE